MMREAAPHYEENMRNVRRIALGGALTNHQIAAMREPRVDGTVKFPTIEDAVRRGGFLAGRPEDLIEALTEVEKRDPASTSYLRYAWHPARGPARRARALSEGGDPAFRDTRTAAEAWYVWDQPRVTATRLSSPSMNFFITHRTFVDGGNSQLSALGS